MANKNRITLYVLLLLLSACRNNSTPVGDTSRNSLDWQGVYHGVLPCADCPGIITAIQLNDDNTFVMSTSYIGKTEVEQKSGSFTWDQSGSQITLEGLDEVTNPVYKVGENKLIPMDGGGNPVAGDRANQYTLTKESEDVTNKYWKLTSVNNKKVVMGQNQQKEPHMILHPFDSTVTGSGGCNGFRGTYELTANNGLSFSPLAATKMFCTENMDVENQMFKALTEASNYKVSGDSLFLFNNQKEKSATFAVVYLR